MEALLEMAGRAAAAPVTTAAVVDQVRDQAAVDLHGLLIVAAG
jgi:hypothetical protein